MSQRDFSDVMKESLAAIAAGLDRATGEIGVEMHRLGKQGALEMAQALYNGAAFTPYGPGQYTPTPEIGKESQEHGIQKTEPHHEQEREHGGREM